MEEYWSGFRPEYLAYVKSTSSKETPEELSEHINSLIVSSIANCPGYECIFEDEAFQAGKERGGRREYHLRYFVFEYVSLFVWFWPAKEWACFKTRLMLTSTWCKAEAHLAYLNRKHTWIRFFTLWLYLDMGGPFWTDFSILEQAALSERSEMIQSEFLLLLYGIDSMKELIFVMNATVAWWLLKCINSVNFL